MTASVLSAAIDAKVLGGRTVLGRLELALQPGEIVAVVGPSGCGKTTLLRILAGLDTAFAGEVLASGAVLRQPDPRRVGVMFQEPRLLPWLRVADNVALGATDPVAARRRALALLAEVGLDGQADALPRTLSGGMAQRVALARALFPEPAVLLLDEPFSAVDAIARARLRDLVAAVARRHGVAVLIVTHDVEDAVTLASRVLVMASSPGRIRREIVVPSAGGRATVAHGEAALDDAVLSAIALRSPVPSP